jgi:hypothetical protein
MPSDAGLRHDERLWRRSRVISAGCACLVAVVAIEWPDPDQRIKTETIGTLHLGLEPTFVSPDAEGNIWKARADRRNRNYGNEFAIVSQSRESLRGRLGAAGRFDFSLAIFVSRNRRADTLRGQSAAKWSTHWLGGKPGLPPGRQRRMARAWGSGRGKADSGIAEVGADRRLPRTTGEHVLRMP